MTESQEHPGRQPNVRGPHDRFKQIEVTDGGGGITIARFRASGPAQLEEVCELFPVLDADPSTEVLVLAGTEQSFFRGPSLEDIRQQRADVERLVKHLPLARRTVHNIINFEKPIVAAVEGPAVGLGAQLALLADIVVASEETWFKDSHVGIGVTAGDGGVLIWPLLFGLGRAKLHLLTGKRLMARDAYAAGAIAELVTPGAAEASALGHAEWLVKRPRFALLSTKSALNQWLRAGATTAFDYGWALEYVAQFLPEAREGIEAAIAKAS